MHAGWQKGRLIRQWTGGGRAGDVRKDMFAVALVLNKLSARPKGHEIGPKFVPYRSSRITLLLKPLLCSGGALAVICTGAPQCTHAAQHTHSSSNTLDAAHKKC